MKNLFAATPTVACAIFLAAACATVVPHDRTATPRSVPTAQEPQEMGPCKEGLELVPGDSCVHEGGRFWVEDGQDGRACYTGRYLASRPSEPLCSPKILNEVCLVDGRRSNVVVIGPGFADARTHDCHSDAFGFGADRVAETSRWKISQVRQVQHVEQDGGAIRVEGTCQATPCTSQGRSCLRLRSSIGGGCIVSGYGYECRLMPCNSNRINATLFKNGELRTHGNCDVGGCGQ